MSNLKVNTINDANGGSNAVLYGVASPVGSMGFRNRLLNSDMRIDQRNAGASVTQTTGNLFPVDRFAIYGDVASKFTAQRSTTAPAGFTNSLLITSSSAYSVGAGEVFTTAQFIEGFNVADLGFGTASAQSITLSFWVRSSLTGTFGGAVQNGTNARSYPFSYTINSANTFEYKTITIAGDTSGTWATDNSTGLTLRFGLGVGATKSGTAGSWSGSDFRSATGATSVVGTNGATFYITGVQLEAGTNASAFERRDYGRELIMCQRYYYKNLFSSSTGRWGVCFCDSTTVARLSLAFPVQMRDAPTALEQTGTASNYSLISSSGSVLTCSAVPTFGSANELVSMTNFTVASGLTGGNATQARTNAANTFLAWSAEL